MTQTLLLEHQEPATHESINLDPSPLTPEALGSTALEGQALTADMDEPHVKENKPGYLIPEEPDLIRQAQGGSKEAFGQLYSLYYPRIFGTIYGKIGNRPAAEDLTQDVFLKSMSAIARFEDRGYGLGPWLSRSAHNVAVSYTRKPATQREIASEDLEDRGSQAPSPEDFVVGQAAAKELIAAIPQTYRKSVVDTVVAGKSREQSAVTQGVDPKTVATRKHRGLAALRAAVPQNPID